MRQSGCDMIYLGAGFRELRDVMQEAATALINRPKSWTVFEAAWLRERPRRKSEIEQVMEAVRNAYAGEG
jgi:hypothetical protein